MKRIKSSRNGWPRKRVKSIDCRARDLVIRIADWSKDKDEPAYDVEVYIGGVYDFDESKTFTKREFVSCVYAKVRAKAFAQLQIAKLL